MAITLLTPNPTTFLSNLKQQIDANKIETWSYDAQGDFTHSPKQWINKAWMRPKLLAGKLVFSIVCRNDEKLSKEIYAVYHGRFIEMLLAHEDKNFTYVTASAMPEGSDIL